MTTTPLTEELITELHAVLANASGRLGESYAAYRSGATTPTAIFEAGAAAGVGAASSLLATIRSILDNTPPGGAAYSKAAMHRVSNILRKQEMSADARDYLTDLMERLRARSEDTVAQEADEKALEEASDVLESAIRDASGVYVYSYAHYLNYPWKPDSRRVLLKIGSTSQKAWQRVQQQVRETAVPEEPVLLRVYETDNPAEVERVFHRLLDSAEHERSGRSMAGSEWFSTSLGFLDEIADALNLRTIEGAGSPAGI